MASVDAAIDHARANREAHLAEYKELLRIPSISTLPAHRDDVHRAAGWMAEQLRALGMTRVEIMPTPLHPVVYGEWLGAPGKPTVLVYGHYDVQPVDPLNEWESGPFDAEVRGDYIYARGASDMKGQILAQLKSVECLVRTGGLPVNLKYLIEGEEEVGSPSIDAFIEEHGDLLECDMVLNCDAGIYGLDLPGIVYSLRGLAYFQLDLRGAQKDMHSGMFGGAVRNAGQVLCELISGMHDADGRVTLPGFYDKVRPLTDKERRLTAQLPHDDAQWMEMAGVKALHGEKGYSTLERIGARPTLEVNGLLSGFTGEGSKTVLPARAMAKISTRLVPDQTPAEVGEQLRAYLEAHVPEGVDWSVKDLAGGEGAVMELDSRVVRAAAAALREVFGKEPLFKREGGSVPIVGLLTKKLGVDTVMLGFALPDDGIHGPNEKQHLPTWYKGIETYIRFLGELG